MEDRLSHFIRTYDDSLPPGFCKRLIQGFESSTGLQRRNGRGVRAGLDGSGWTEVNINAVADEAFLGFFYARIDEYLARYNADIGLGIPVPNRPRIDRLTLKRYSAATDDQFQPHFDSVDAVSERYLVFLWYLNDVDQGGETLFTDLGLRVAPKEGRLLIFPPFWMYQHAGLPPLAGSKYILSTYLMFKAEPIYEQAEPSPVSRAPHGG